MSDDREEKVNARLEDLDRKFHKLARTAIQHNTVLHSVVLSQREMEAALRYECNMCKEKVNRELEALNDADERHDRLLGETPTEYLPTKVAVMFSEYQHLKDEWEEWKRKSSEDLKTRVSHRWQTLVLTITVVLSVIGHIINLIKVH